MYSSQCWTDQPVGACRRGPAGTRLCWRCRLTTLARRYQTAAGSTRSCQMETCREKEQCLSNCQIVVSKCTQSADHCHHSDRWPGTKIYKRDNLSKKGRILHYPRTRIIFLNMDLLLFWIIYFLNFPLFIVFSFNMILFQI